jgi:hypothetical protein
MGQLHHDKLNQVTDLLLEFQNDLGEHMSTFSADMHQSKYFKNIESMLIDVQSVINEIAGIDESLNTAIVDSWCEDSND